MPLLNTAGKVYVGSTEADKVYVGSTEVWSNLPPVVLPAIGGAVLGGFYAGIIDTTVGNIIAADASQSGLRYALIVAPKSLEVSSFAYKTANTSAPAAARTRWDGLSATQAMAADAETYPAADYCAGLSWTDARASSWYLPAMDELQLIYRNLKPTTESNGTGTTVTTSDQFPPSATIAPGANPSSDPVGTANTTTVPARTSVAAFQSGGAEALGDTGVVRLLWTATEMRTASPWTVGMAGTVAGNLSFANKSVSNAAYGTRPVRRYLIP